MQKEWKSLKSFFEELNSKCNYVVLRNWDDLSLEEPYIYGHNDIDILCESLEKFLSFSNARCIHKYKNRDNYVVSIASKEVRFDVRHVGDGYFDENWEKQLLKDRRREDFFYVPSLEMYPYSLAYHALIQKKYLSEDYRTKLASFLNIPDISKSELLNLLKNYCDDNRFEATIPMDPGVFFNFKNASLFKYRKNIAFLLNRFLLKIYQKMRFPT